NPKVSSYIETLRLMDEIWRRKESCDVILMVLKRIVRGVKSLSFSRNERMLEVVLERVISTHFGIHDLKGDLLSLTHQSRMNKWSITYESPVKISEMSAEARVK
ncbi:hypothetical protein HAX54_036381, partial [Datura stramonium]|nr:hypothetical protein [Datura stramonium]